MTNEHGALRHRKSKDAPLQNSRQLDLGTLNDDVRGIEIVRYEAPILLVKVTTKDGELLKDAKISAAYGEGRGQHAGKFNLADGLQSDVFFEKQEDGRFRSSQLFPDEDVTITAQADGYESRSEKLQLPEGGKKDLVLVLEKK
ncbi:MAG: carboxypeptidase regulatory-like domain-containing protein [Planctomycetes bacterium]|nr:carboxypeptidase regulatory-like domain-containing protein [Planctomycetota bacterium]